MQILEVLSVQVAEKRLKKPVQVPRPDFLLKPAGDGIKHAVHVLRSTRGRVRH